MMSEMKNKQEARKAQASYDSRGGWIVVNQGKNSKHISGIEFSGQHVELNETGANILSQPLNSEACNRINLELRNWELSLGQSNSLKQKVYQ
jgi:hypothetical protein